MDNRAVGVMDSGVGGVSVAHALVRLMPEENYLYYGDTANAPYGDRSEAEIRALTERAARRLLDRDVKALVIACNTATSATAQALRAMLPIPVVGMEPALKPAAHAVGAGVVLVLATTATLRQKKFQALMAEYGDGALVAPCPGLMEFAERGELDSPALDAYLRERLREFDSKAVAAVVLGCTHYIFLKRAIARALPGAQLFDGNDGTARRLKSILDDLDARAEGPGSVSFDSSDPAAIPIMHRLFDSLNDCTEK